MKLNILTLIGNCKRAMTGQKDPATRGGVSGRPPFLHSSDPRTQFFRPFVEFFTFHPNPLGDRPKDSAHQNERSQFSHDVPWLERFRFHDAQEASRRFGGARPPAYDFHRAPGESRGDFITKFLGRLERAHQTSLEA